MNIVTNNFIEGKDIFKVDLNHAEEARIAREEAMIHGYVDLSNYDYKII